MLTGVNHIDRRHPLCRVGGHGFQHPLEPLDQRGDGVGVEYVGAELDRPPDPGGFTGIGEVFGQRERQVHAGGVGVHRHPGDLQIAQGRPGSRVTGVSGQVLPGQHHLHQRMMRQRPVRIEPLNEHLKRHIPMLKSGQPFPADLGQQLRHRGITGQIHPQHQRVDEEPDQFVERRIITSGDREPQRHIGTGAEPRQQHRQPSLDHHETCRVVLRSHLTHPLLQLRGPIHRHISPALISHRRIGPIRRQLQALGHPGQRIPPVR